MATRKLLSLEISSADFEALSSGEQVMKRLKLVSVDGQRIELDTAECVDKYQRRGEGVNLSAQTNTRREYVLRPFAEAYPALPTDPDHITAFIYRRDYEVSDETVFADFSILRGFYAWLLRNDIIAYDENPFRKLEAPKVSKKLPRTISAPEVVKVLQAAKYGRERAVLLTILDSGCRAGELVGTKTSDLRENGLQIMGKGRIARLLPLSRPTREFLLNFAADVGTEFLFPKAVAGKNMGMSYYLDEPASRMSLSQDVRRVLQRAGFTGLKLGPHMLRHTFGTLFIKANGDVLPLSKILGHTTIRMTQRYVHLADDDLVEKHSQFGLLPNLMREMGIDVDTRRDPIAELPEPKIIEAQVIRPRARVPGEVKALPLAVDGKRVNLLLVQDTRSKGKKVYYRINAYTGTSLIKQLPLGSDLPADVVKSYKIEVARLNIERLRELNRQGWLERSPDPAAPRPGSYKKRLRTVKTKLADLKAVRR